MLMHIEHNDCIALSYYHYTSSSTVTKRDQTQSQSMWTSPYHSLDYICGVEATL